MAKNVKNLLDRMGPKRRARVENRVNRALAVIPLPELRRACGVTQTQIAESLEMTQASVSKIERQTDMYVSTLRRFVESLGGSLQIVVNLPSGSFTVDRLSSEDG